MERHVYAEPFAGGCGLALNLLYEGNVRDIHINDIDPGIWAFWHCVLNLNEELVDKILDVKVDIAEWVVQKEVYNLGDVSDPLSLGFATFFLNRTNRSGIIKKAGAIGGFNQTGPYKIDCRFNKKDLCLRIRRIAKYRSQIHLSNLDALDFIDNMNQLDKKVLLCIDPPYFKKGKGLYTNFYEPGDHEVLSKKILNSNHPWIVTYDKADVIRKLFESKRQFEFDITYTLQDKRKGTEVLIMSDQLISTKQMSERRLLPNSIAA